jgi:hypothetical protein
MPNFTKLEQIRRHLRPATHHPKAPETGKRVQKNLSIMESDAARLAALAERDGISQARLLSAALDAYQRASNSEKTPKPLARGDD